LSVTAVYDAVDMACLTRSPLNDAQGDKPNADDMDRISTNMVLILAIDIT